MREFTTKRALCDPWDIVHVHWPDMPVHRLGIFSASLAAAYHILRLLYAKLRGAKIVWTVHNLHSHCTTHPKLEQLFWRRFLPLVDASIHLSRSGMELAMKTFPALASRPRFVIPHGNYRDCYPNNITRENARRYLGLRPDGPVIGFVGQIRPYKNVPTLAEAFIDGHMDEATLLIAGKASDRDAEQKLRAFAEKAANVVCRFGLIPEDEMQNYLNACDLAVFPYRDILNSGSAILALSFDRPVLVPAKGAMGELRELIGSEWVMTYEGDLTGAVLRKALQWAGEQRRERCDLSALAWDVIGGQTHAAFREVLANIPSTVTSSRKALA